MADEDRDAGGDEAARLEAALERIARAAARPVPAADLEAESQRAQRTAEVAARLDTLIAELREVLGPDDAPVQESPALDPPEPMAAAEVPHHPGVAATPEPAAAVATSAGTDASLVPQAGRDPADPN